MVVVMVTDGVLDGPSEVMRYVGTVNLIECVPAQLETLPQATLTAEKTGFLLEPD